jgi:hypothetical protein
MQLSNVVSAIGRIPLEFKARGNISMVQLLAESGFLANQSLVTVELLSAHFSEHPEDLVAWHLKSLDNGGSPSWYLLDPGDANAQGKWVVGFFPGEHREYFERGEDACAVFVKNWLIQVSAYAHGAS